MIASEQSTTAPDFFIAGAPKCGTTALFQYLSRHPSVFIPRIKEPNFFCSDLKTFFGIHDEFAYRALFAATAPGAVTGDASSMYLYSKIAIPRMMAHNPAAKVIVILRNPANAAHSRHASSWNHGRESIADFEQAWHAQDERRRGRGVPPGWPDPATLQYGAIYRYADQIRRVLTHVPEAQRHIVLYEEFFADPSRHYGEILRFLNLPPDNRATFRIVNPAIGPRSARLEQLLRQPPMWLKRLYAPIRPLFHAAAFFPKSALWRLNSVPRQKSPLRPAFRDELKRYFADDIAELEGMLGRRLWRQA